MCTRATSPQSQLPTRFVCVSDTHSHALIVPDGDVLLYSGDLADKGTASHFERTTKMSIRFGTLHTEWYERQHIWHDRLGKQVCCCILLPVWKADYYIQDIMPIMKMLKGARAQQAGIVYLQDEKHEFKVHEDGKLWSIYGSPVSTYLVNASSSPDKRKF